MSEIKFKTGDEVYYLCCKHTNIYNEAISVMVSFHEIIDIDRKSEECYLLKNYYDQEIWATRFEVFASKKQALNACYQFLRKIFDESKN